MPFAFYALHKSTCYAGTMITLKLLRLHKEIESQHLIKFAIQCARGAVNCVSRRIRLSNTFLVGTQIVKSSELRVIDTP